MRNEQKDSLHPDGPAQVFHTTCHASGSVHCIGHSGEGRKREAEMERGEMEMGDMERGEMERGEMERGEMERGEMERWIEKGSGKLRRGCLVERRERE